jgi:hypothetical protein
MELLLNLLWLSLALPAYWIWERHSVPVHDSLARIRSLVFLGCGLALLFPVISATDDLSAPKPDAEEVRASKCTAKWSLGTKSGRQPKDYTSLAHSRYLTSFKPGYESWDLAVAANVSFPEALSLGTSACRAPPLPCLT